jgi:DNA-binding transcriptional ArsR family regulator
MPTLKEVLQRSEEVAELHSTLTSPRGDYFRLRLLQALEDPADEATIKQRRVESGVHEYQRHLNKLLRSGLVSVKEIEGQKKYTRTGLGERAVNAVRELQRSIGKEDARAIYSAALDPNSMRFFLRVYGDKPTAGRANEEITYTLAEVGRLSLFLPRVIDGISAVDKIGEAGLLVYGDDGYVYMPPVKARSFYRFLKELYEIVRANAMRNATRWHQG